MGEAIAARIRTTATTTWGVPAHVDSEERRATSVPALAPMTKLPACKGGQNSRRRSAPSNAPARTQTSSTAATALAANQVTTANLTRLASLSC